MSISLVEFRNFKAFERFDLRLDAMNVLVGPNNTGKSTIIGAFRVVAAGLQVAKHRKPRLVDGPGSAGPTYGYLIPSDSIPTSLENVHTDYDETNDSTIRLHLSNKNSLILYFTPDNSVVLIPIASGKRITSPSDFNKAFPFSVTVIPVLGPVENDEQVVSSETVQRNLSTHRASRNFRNYWRYHSDEFSQFQEMVRRTWPGMDVEVPSRVDGFGSTLSMFCYEDRIARELYWVGSGFQIWCQLLTHILRGMQSTLLVVDEPEIYLHPNLQRQLVGILSEAGPDTLLATHSSEIVSEAEPTDLLLINKARRSATRVASPKDVQVALQSLGSIQNTALTQLARTRRVIFVEGQDFKIIRQVARRMGMAEVANGLDFVVVPLGGFPVPEYVVQMARGMEEAIGTALRFVGIFDRDYRCQEEIDELTDKLQLKLDWAHIYIQKEIENYLIKPGVNGQFKVAAGGLVQVIVLAN